jgi:hypothetical protein
VSTTNTPVEMEKIKIESSTTQEPHEIEYVDVELFSEDEEMKVGNGKVPVVEWVEIFSVSVLQF